MNALRSGVVAAALLGTRDHGRWLLAPAAPAPTVRRGYRDGTMILETEFTTPEGTVCVVDFMPIRDDAPDRVRIVVGVRGAVTMRTEVFIRFDYGSIVPWVTHIAGGLGATRALPSRQSLRSW